MPWLQLHCDADAASAEALSETVVQGIKTNIPLHQELMQDARFVEGGTSIHYLEHKLAAKNEVKSVEG